VVERHSKIPSIAAENSVTRKNTDVTPGAFSVTIIIWYTLVPIQNHRVELRDAQWNPVSVRSGAERQEMIVRFLASLILMVLAIILTFWDLSKDKWVFWTTIIMLFISVLMALVSILLFG